MNGDEFTIAVLLGLAVVGMYFVQDKRARAGIGLAAIGLALFAGLRRKPKAEPASVITPDTHEKERIELLENIEQLDATVDAASVDTNPDVLELRARLKARRGSLHDALGDSRHD